MSKKPVDLHTILAFQEIAIREGVKLRPLAISDAKDLLTILDSDRTIRERVLVASRLYTPEDVVAEIEKYRRDIGLIR